MMAKPANMRNQPLPFNLSMVVNIDPSLLNKHHRTKPFTMQRVHDADRSTGRLYKFVVER